jgi:hypothetical protein
MIPYSPNEALLNDPRQDLRALPAMTQRSFDDHSGCNECGPHDFLAEIPT